MEVICDKGRHRAARASSAALCAALCAAMCAHNCERHCELCGNVAWFGMVGRKRLYERKEVMV